MTIAVEPAANITPEAPNQPPTPAPPARKRHVTRGILVLMILTVAGVVAPFIANIFDSHSGAGLDSTNVFPVSIDNDTAAPLDAQLCDHGLPTVPKVSMLPGGSAQVNVSAGGPATGSAAIASLPAGCDDAAPAPTSTSVSFAAGGRVWAFSPDDPANLHCLFTQADAGAFSWGPRGDRVVLAGLQVTGVGSTAARPAGNFHPAYFTWSRPSGTTIWFTAGSRSTVFRADIGSASATEVTPLPNVTYGDMAYHPSGLAVGFVSTGASGTGLWVSTNTGANSMRLV